MMIVTAESCTGGGLAQAITEISGSSTWFDRGFITYSNRSKVQMLQVKQQSLDEYGAVSQQVAIEMVDGALLNTVADLAVSVTGIAGPGGGSEQKPVGTVYIASKIRGKKGVCELKHFLGDRAQVRKQAIQSALVLCIQ
jgi:nicotinamide-nucleotide amidase